MQVDEDCRLVCPGCYVEYATDEEIAISLAAIEIESRDLVETERWRDAIGMAPELDRVAPGHTRGVVAFWIVLIVCAAGLAYGIWSH
jgi:hypothetical protein